MLVDTENLVVDASPLAHETPKIAPNEKLSFAKQYLEKGMIPFPATYPISALNGTVRCSCGVKACNSPGKHPNGAWKGYQTKHPKQHHIEKWFGSADAGNVGLIHGKLSNTVVLDWDGPIGLATRENLEAKLGQLPPGPTVATPGGGEHQYFRHTGGAIPTRAGVANGLDIRADGGFTIAPPSRHMNGGAYAWKPGQALDDAPLPDLPTAWIEFISSNNTLVDVERPVSKTVEPLSGQDKLVDGRETYMRDTIAAVLHEICSAKGSIPSADELFEAAWPQYERNVDLSKPGRGIDEFRQKCQYTVVRALNGALGSITSSGPTATAGIRKEQQTRDPLQVLTTSEAYELPAPKWLVDGLLIGDSIALLYGPPGSLKSFFAVDIGMSIATGRPWVGREVERAGVAYIAAEGAAGIGLRCAAWEHSHRVVGQPNLFRLIPTNVNLREPDQVENLIERLREVGKKDSFHFELVIFDTLARSMVGGDENSALEVGIVMEAATKIRRELGSTVLMVHHTGKDTKRGMRGSNRFLADADTTIEVERDEDERCSFTVTVRKQKEAEDGQEYSLIAEQVMLPTRPGRGAESSLIVKSDPNDPARKKEASKIADRQIIASLMADGDTLSVSKVADLVKEAFGMGRGMNLFKRIMDALPMEQVFKVPTQSGVCSLVRKPAAKGVNGEVTRTASVSTEEEDA